VLNGLVISGELSMDAPIGAGLVLQHCTLVPGRALTRVGEPRDLGGFSVNIQTAESSFPPLEFMPVPLLIGTDRSAGQHFQLVVSRCISGPIVLHGDACGRAVVEESIIDALEPGSFAFGAGTATLRASTILGSSSVETMELASDCIFTGPLNVTRPQTGCVRFSYVHPDSQTPERYRCQPDLAILDEPDPAQHPFIKASLVPSFTSVRYGQPGYGQLGRSCPDAIRRGGTDEGEMGVFHHLFQPQREAALRAGLRDYLRFGLEAEIFFVT
jgi:hypothetical protein